MLPVHEAAPSLSPEQLRALGSAVAVGRSLPKLREASIYNAVLRCCAFSLFLVLLVLLEGEGGPRWQPGPCGGGGTGTLSLWFSVASFPAGGCEQQEVAGGVEIWFWCVADPPAEWFLLEKGRLRGCGRFVSQKSCVLLMFGPDSHGMAGSRLQLLQPWLPSSLR